MSNNKLIKLSEILYSYYKKNKSLPDFEYFKELIPDKSGYQDKVDDRFELSSYQSILDIVRKHRERKERYLSSGYKHIDKVLNTGGWKPGSTYCVMGLTGTGKSIFLCNFAVQSMKSRYETLYIFTEMDHIQIYDRILLS